MADKQEKSNRPSDSPFKQQKLKAWQPILTPNWVVGTFGLISVVFIPIGAALFSASEGVKEHVITYDDPDKKSGWCATNPCTATDDSAAFQKIEAGSKNYTGTISFTIAEDMSKPVYLYYELENFYQNHRRYVKSRSDNQLRGVDPWTKTYDNTWDDTVKMDSTSGSQTQTPVDVFSQCKPLVLPNHVSDAGCTWNSTNSAAPYEDIPCKVMWPCGLIAGSFFNDVFCHTELDANGECPDSDSWSEKGIAWQTDIDTKFKNPTKETAGWNWDDEVAKGTSSKYYMLHQQYPNFPKLAEEGVENEHFIVWMRTAGLPTFRKLYAKIDKDLKKGDKFDVQVTARFDVSTFKGKKRLVLSTTSWMGGKNPFLGVAYIVVGGISLVLAVGFFVLDRLRPRKLGDTNYLVWREGAGK